MLATRERIELSWLQEISDDPNRTTEERGAARDRAAIVLLEIHALESAVVSETFDPQNRDSYSRDL